MCVFSTTENPFAAESITAARAGSVTKIAIRNPATICRMRLIDSPQRFGLFLEQFEQSGPAAIDAAAHPFAALFAERLEIAVFELNASRACSFGDKTDFDFRCDRGIGLPVGANLPTEDDAAWRLPCPHVADDDLASIFMRRVPAAAVARLDEGLLDRRLADAMPLRPPTIEPARKDIEGVGLRCVHHERLADRRDRESLGHLDFSPSKDFSASL